MNFKVTESQSKRLWDGDICKMRYMLKDSCKVTFFIVIGTPCWKIAYIIRRGFAAPLRPDAEFTAGRRDRLFMGISKGFYEYELVVFAEVF